MTTDATFEMAVWRGGRAAAFGVRLALPCAARKPALARRAE